MCAVSNIGDSWQNVFPERYPWYPYTSPTREEFDILKAEVWEFKRLLLAAKRFDDATGQKDCEMENKIAFMKSVADYVGVDLKEIFK